MGTAALEKKNKHTYADYEKLPEGSPYQLIGGELVMTPAPTPYHQIITGNIFFELMKFVKAQGAGTVLNSPIDVYLAETEGFQPDVIFIAQERLSIIGQKKIEAAPDLVVEVLSPSTAYYDLRHKMRLYESSGVREYWIVDPEEKSIEVYENAGGEFKLFNKAREKGVAASKLLPGFEVGLDVVFS